MYEKLGLLFSSAFIGFVIYKFFFSSKRIKKTLPPSSSPSAKKEETSSVASISSFENPKTEFEKPKESNGDSQQIRNTSSPVKIEEQPKDVEIIKTSEEITITEDIKITSTESVKTTTEEITIVRQTEEVITAQLTTDSEKVIVIEESTTLISIPTPSEGKEPLEEREETEIVTKEVSKSPKILYLMRGVPGSGKSTLAKSILSEEHPNSNGVILSSDDYFEREGKGYIFNPKELGNAHQYNQDRCLDAIKNNLSPIIIDNTNTQRWEAKYYVEQALDHGYEVRIREPDTVWWLTKNAEEMAAKNTHKVPVESIRNMINRFEDNFTVEEILKSQKPVYNNNKNNNRNNNRRK